ncbi:hypothetical protein PIB30_075032 [Stylosanthes scabra]|uniref:Uncharacterized protein n=1 Tax=Stylosanthes scabra TaxID=79078 RepID=A0ABU6XN65_9FABA|nr:hypothetical protein [Stylosanthes scabra]
MADRDRKRKGKAVATSSNQASPRFKTLYHESHFNSMLSARRILPELILQVDEDVFNPIRYQIYNRKWEKFTKPIQVVGHLMVKEFYANAWEPDKAKRKHPTYTSSMRGTEGSRRDKPTIEFDPKIEKTLKKNQNRVKAQRTLQFDQEEVNSEEGASEKSFEEELVEENIEEEIQDNMADNANNQRRTLADYTNPTTTSCGSSIVWPNADANNFELKPALVQLVQQN